MTEALPIGVRARYVRTTGISPLSYTATGPDGEQFEDRSFHELKQRLAQRYGEGIDIYRATSRRRLRWSWRKRRLQELLTG